MNSQGHDFGKLKSKTNIKKGRKLQEVFFPPELLGGRFPCAPRAGWCEPPSPCAAAACPGRGMQTCSHCRMSACGFLCLHAGRFPLPQGRHAGIFFGIAAGVRICWYSPHERCKGTVVFDGCAIKPGPDKVMLLRSCSGLCKHILDIACDVLVKPSLAKKAE